MSYFNHNEVTRKIIIYLSICVGIFFLAIAIILDVDAKPKESKMYNQILSESARIVPLPQDTELHRSFTEKPELISYYISYQTNLDFNVINDYYYKELTSLGWVYKGEKPIKVWDKDYGGKKALYTKNDISLAVRYAGDDPNATETYAIWLNWYYWGKLDP